MNVLFICSMNKWRSPTAEEICRRHPDLSVRSAGTSRKARRHVTLDDIQWAEPLFLDLLEHLVEWVEGAAFIVALARPEIREIRPAFAEVGRRVGEVIALEGLEAALAVSRGEPCPYVNEGKLICHCLWVREERIARNIRERRLRTVDEVRFWTRACSGCRSCRTDVEDLLQKHAPPLKRS